MYKICQTEKSIARQRELENGFLHYLENVPYLEIDIAGLCRYLEIPRKTFYRYFGTKEDALYALIDHRLVDMDQYVLRMCAGTPSVRQDALFFFTFWKEQQRFLDILRKNQLLSVVTTRVNTQDVANMREFLYRNRTSTFSNLYVYGFLMSGIMSMMIRWYENGFQESTEQMADLVESIYDKPLKALFHY